MGSNLRPVLSLPLSLALGGSRGTPTLATTSSGWEEVIAGGRRVPSATHPSSAGVDRGGFPHTAEVG